MDCRIREAHKSEKAHGDFPEVPWLYRLQSLASVNAAISICLGQPKRPEARVSRVLGGKRKQGFKVNPCPPSLQNNCSAASTKAASIRAESAAPGPASC